MIDIKGWGDVSRSIAAALIWTGEDMNISEAIYGQQAMCEFTAEPVKEELLRQLIDAAIEAPSTINQQPLLFTIVRDRRLLARISDEAKAHMVKTSPAGLVSHHSQHILTDPKFDIFYGAPVLIVISADRGPWAIGDCALAAQNLMLAAHAAGLATCWIGFAQGWLGTPKGRSVLKLPESDIPVAPIIVGHPKSVPPKVVRKPARIDWVS